MQDQVIADPAPHRPVPWNKGKLTGAKPPLRPKHVWSIRTKLQIEGRARDLAMFNLAIDSKLRGCDVVAIRVEDVAASGYTADRATVRQKKTGRPVRFEMSEQTGQAPVPKVSRTIPLDGLDALRAEIGLQEIASLIERTARWVSSETFALLPVWYPEHARGAKFYKSNWLEPLMNTKRSTGGSAHKTEGNVYGNTALTLALGLRKHERPNWTCCHVWGLDDSTFQTANAVVQDSRFYSCVANMVLLPMPLKAFTDGLPEIKAMLRTCAFNLYGWRCDHACLADVTVVSSSEWGSAYPKSWPSSRNEKRPAGLVELNDRIRLAASARISAVKSDLKNAAHFTLANRSVRFWIIGKYLSTDESIERIDLSDHFMKSHSCRCP